MSKARTTWRILVEALGDFSGDRITTHAAALAFYTVLSIAPLLLAAIAIAGLFVGESTAQSEVFKRLEEVMGADAAKMALGVLSNLHTSHHGTLAIVLSLAAVLFGATGVFSQLQDSLNTIWKVTTKPGVSLIKTFFRKRLLTFVVLLAVGALLLASLMLSAVLAGMRKYLGFNLPGSLTLWEVLNIAITFAMSIVLFATVYRILPDVRMMWGYVWWGSVFTAAMFALGRVGIGLYIRYSGAGSAYGAAGALVILLLWVYYSSIIFLLGAEFIHAYAKCRGKEIPPAKHAVRVSKPKPIMPGQADDGDERGQR